MRLIGWLCCSLLKETVTHYTHSQNCPLTQPFCPFMPPLFQQNTPCLGIRGVVWRGPAGMPMHSVRFSANLE